MIMEILKTTYDEEYSKNTQSKSCSLEMAYLETIRKTDLVIKDENTRRLRLRILLLEEDNDKLHEQLAIGDDRNDELEQDCAALQEQLEHVEADSRYRETEMRIKARELSNIKAELSSMSCLSVDSTKLLTEKLSLTRELAAMRPEVEHLRSQVTNQQTILAEKLTLQRQVSTLEVELETEKRATKRTTPKNNRDEADILQRQTDELRRQLSKENKEHEKVQKAWSKEMAAWEARKALLESKVEQLRVKLRESKDQVKSLQNDLIQAQVAGGNHSVPSMDENVPGRGIRKRQAAQMSFDAVIGTPDGVVQRGKRITAKRSNQDQTLLSEKSMFSITPYLNRTISIAPDTPRQIMESKTNNKQETEGNIQTPSKNQHLQVSGEGVGFTQNAISQLAQPQSKQGGCIEIDMLKASKDAALNKKAPSKKGRIIDILEKVREEDDENFEPIAAKPSTEEPVRQVKDAEPKKKRRKILGAAKTLFDDEDVDVAKRPPKIILASTKSSGQGKPAGGIASLHSGPARNSSTFGAFSPLKKDRRTAQVSFVA